MTGFEKLYGCFSPFSPTVYSSRQSLARTSAVPSATSTRQPTTEPLTVALYGTVLWSTSTRAHGLDAYATHAACTAKTEASILASCADKLMLNQRSHVNVPDP